MCDSLTTIKDEKVLEYLKLFQEYKENILYFNNIHSQGPYTEVAISAILTGEESLDSNGYMQNLKYNSNTMFEIFKDNGFKTHSPFIYNANPLSFLRGVDEYFYAYSNSFTPCNEYRIDYFKDLYKNNKINNYHIEQICILIEDYFESVEIYFDDYINKPYRFEQLKKYTDFSKLETMKLIDILKKEKETFDKDKENYCYELLKNNVENIGLIKDVKFNVSQSYYKYKRKFELRCIYESIKQLSSIVMNYKNNKCIEFLNQNLKRARENEKSIFIEALKGIMHMNNYPFKPLQLASSAHLHLEKAEEYIVKSESDKNFVFTHLMDNHFPINFFSYDVDDIDMIKDEYKSFKMNLSRKNKISKNRFYDLSVKYVDSKLIVFLDNLKKSGKLDETLVVITADHGTSFLGDIFRWEKTTNLYDENYKIPLILLNSGLKGGIRSDLDLVLI